MQLHPDAERSGVRLIAYDTLGSTNAEALARGRAGERGPLWITAARQTAGRGRRGNAWVSEPGNLYASLLLTDAAPAAHLPELCFVVALAVRDAVCGGAPRSFRPKLKLKWPNDLLLDGAKLAGILIEAESVGRQGNHDCGHWRELRAPPDRPCLSGDQSRRRTVQSVGPAACSPNCRARCWRGLPNGIAARASRRSAPSGCPMPLVWAATSRCACADRELTGTFEALDAAGPPDAAPAGRCP